MPQSDLTPAGRVRRLVEVYGSDDKLAKELGTTRQVVIGWRTGRHTPRASSVAKLLRAEETAELTGRPWPTERQETTPQGLAREVRLIRQAVEAIADGMDELGRGLEELQVLVREQGRPVPRRHAGGNG